MVLQEVSSCPWLQKARQAFTQVQKYGRTSSLSLPHFLFFPKHLVSQLSPLPSSLYSRATCCRSPGTHRCRPSQQHRGTRVAPGWIPARQEPESAEIEGGGVILPLPGQRLVRRRRSRGLRAPQFWAGGHLLKIWNCCAEKTNKSRCSPTFCSIVSHGREDIKCQSDDCISGWVYCKGNYWRIFFFSCELGIVYTARKNPTVLFCGVIFLTFVLFQLF